MTEDKQPPTQPIEDSNDNQNNNKVANENLPNEDTNENNQSNTEAKDFVSDILKEIEEEETVRNQKIKEDTDARVKGILKEGFKGLKDLEKKLVKQYEEKFKEQETKIEELKTQINDESSGSKLPNTSNNDPFINKNGIDPNNDDQVVGLLKKKFGIE